MKDKRTAKEKAANERFIKHLDTNGVVGCNHKVEISPPGSDEPKEERVWTLIISQDAHYSSSGVVVAWYKTKTAAVKHARLLRKALTFLQSK